MKTLRNWIELPIGLAWWALIHAWGAVLLAIVLLLPLGLAVGMTAILDWLTPTAALGLGVALSFLVGVPPWTAEERSSLPLILVAATASWIGWALMVGAGVTALVVAMGVAVIGWSLRAVARRFIESHRARSGSHA
jgi:hypothetical protein